MKAVQLPHDIRGEALCRHQQAGGCTWWCSYRRAVLCIGPILGVLLAIFLSVWMTGDEDTRTRMAEAFGALAIFLLVTVPVVLYLNARDTD